MKGNIAIADELYKASAISEAPKEITEIFCARNDRASFQIFLDAEHEACRVNTGSAPASFKKAFALMDNLKSIN